MRTEDEIRNEIGRLYEAIDQGADFGHYSNSAQVLEWVVGDLDTPPSED